MEQNEVYQEIFSATPVKVLKERTRNVLSQLDDKRILTMRNGTPRDWRGFKDLTEFDEHIAMTAYHDSFTQIILNTWQHEPASTIEKLLNILQKMGRYDIIDDAINFMYEDALSYRTSASKLKLQIPVQIPEISSASNPSISSCFDIEATAVNDDTVGATQRYASYVCYEDDDIEFVQLMVKNLEEKYNLQLCIPERDLTAQGLVEHSAIINFIKNRCNSMVIVLSDAFTRSKQNSFLTMLAQAISVEAQSRIIIPVIYKTCTLPTTLQALSKLDYTRGDKFSCFWARLESSIRQSSGYLASQANSSSMLSISAPGQSPPSPMITGDKSPVLLHPNSSSGYSSYSMNEDPQIDTASSEESLSSSVKVKKFVPNGIITPNLPSNSQEQMPSTSGIESTNSPTPSRRSTSKKSLLTMLKRKRNKK